MGTKFFISGNIGGNEDGARISIEARKKRFGGIIDDLLDNACHIHMFCHFVKLNCMLCYCFSFHCFSRFRDANV